MPPPFHLAMTRDGLAGMGQSHLVRDTSFPTPGKNFLYPIFDPSRSLQLTDSGPSRLSYAPGREESHTLGCFPPPSTPIARNTNTSWNFFG